MSQEESQEELFNRLLTDLEESPEKFPASIFAAIKTPLPSLTRAALSVDCRSFDIIKTMKSGIFFLGGLKGRKLPGKNIHKVYFFKDLAYFILRATNIITKGELLKRLEESCRRPKPFDEAIKQIEKLERIANFSRSKKDLATLTKIKKDLENMKLTLSDKPIVFSSALRHMPDRIDDLISLFKEQFPPPTPRYNIAGAISILLKKFNIHAERPTILRRMERRDDYQLK